MDLVETFNIILDCLKLILLVIMSVELLLCPAVRVHSLYSEHLVPTPILKSVPFQFSSFVPKIRNAWYTSQNNSCPKSPQREKKEKF